jgi:hypothetical protein
MEGAAEEYLTHTVALKTDMRNLGNGKSSLLKQIPTMLKA